jgi:hypothetical protein
MGEKKNFNFCLFNNILNMKDFIPFVNSLTNRTKKNMLISQVSCQGVEIIIRGHL